MKSSEDKVVYTKRYKSLQEQFKESEVKSLESIDTNSFIKKLFAKKKYIPLENKIEAANQVIEQIKSLAEEYEIDIDIIQEEDGISVKLYMYDCLMEGYLKEQLAEYMKKCDKFFVWTHLSIEQDYIMQFEFVTHEIQ